MLIEQIGPIVAPESQILADFFVLSESRLNDHGLTIDFRVNDSEPFWEAQRSFGVDPFKGYLPGFARFRHIRCVIRRSADDYSNRGLGAVSNAVILHGAGSG
jgi:hypothetical protein